MIDYFLYVILLIVIFYIIFNIFLLLGILLLYPKSGTVTTQEETDIQTIIILFSISLTFIVGIILSYLIFQEFFTKDNINCFKHKLHSHSY